MRIGSFFFDHIGEHPLRWPFVLSIPLLLLRLTPLWPAFVKMLFRLGPNCLAALGVAFSVSYVAITLWYLEYPKYTDHLEPVVASASWYAATGKPVYHEANSSNSYSLLYGPNLFLLNGLCLKTLGPSITTSKCAGVLSALMALAGLAGALFAIASWRTALALIGVYVALLDQFQSYSFWGRSDPVLVCVMALAVFGTVRFPDKCAVILGLAAGVAANLKIHAGLYLVPLALFAFQRKRFRGLATAGVVGAGIFCIPFLCPNISFKNYIETVGQAGHHGLSAMEFKKVGEYILTLGICGICLGICLFRSPKRLLESGGKEYFPYLAAAVGAILLIWIPASKHGGGPHHLMPFFPILAVGAARVIALGYWDRSPQPLWNQVALLMLVSWLACCYASGFQRIRLWKREHFEHRFEEAIDIARIIEARGRDYILLSGAGGDSDYPATFAAPMLVFAGFPASVEPGALMERKRAGADLPGLSGFLAGIQKIDARPVMWLIPRGAEPFSMHTGYPPRDFLYSSEFRRDFNSTFKPVASTPCFDLYTSEPH